jgi:uncharacterized protein
MKVGVISDTHDRLPPFSRAVQLLKRMKVEAIFHAGDYVAPFAAKLIAPDVLDVPLHCIYGNNDGERAGLKKVLPGIQDGPLRVTLAGRTIVMHHFDEWLRPQDYVNADVIITGHTHAVVNELRDAAGSGTNGRKQLWLNPGELCGWLTDKSSFAVLDLAALKADIVEVHPG